ncbi:MAG: hypothetical protein ACON5A_03025 [Candidatus Comchoanobacterales bacterium]
MKKLISVLAIGAMTIGFSGSDRHLLSESSHKIKQSGGLVIQRDDTDLKFSQKDFPSVRALIHKIYELNEYPEFRTNENEISQSLCHDIKSLVDQLELEYGSDGYHTFVHEKTNEYIKIEFMYDTCYYR